MEAFLTATLPGEALAQRLPLKAIRSAATRVFVATGIVTMPGAPEVAL